MRLPSAETPIGAYLTTGFKSEGFKMLEAAQKGKYTRMASENPQGP